MRGVFLDYSKYYDLLYRDKDYEREAKFVIDLIRRRHPEPKRLLNIGCGTGRHDPYFVEAGFSVTGIDISKDMLDIARRRQQDVRCEYLHADAREFRGSKPFDAIVSLFHVFSYQSTREDALRFLETVASSLTPQGVAIFDYWHAPGVIHQKPGSPVKRVQSEELEIIRKTFSTVDHPKSLVNVHFDIEVRERSSGRLHSFTEEHRMRYFACHEIDELLCQAGLRGSHHGWLNETGSPGIEDWSAYSVVQKA